MRQAKAKPQGTRLRVVARGRRGKRCRLRVSSDTQRTGEEDAETARTATGRCDVASLPGDETRWCVLASDLSLNGMGGEKMAGSKESVAV